MKQYEKPNLKIEELNIEDILSASDFKLEDVHDITGKDNIFDEIF